VPSSWSPVIASPNEDWTEEELLVLNAALYLVESSLLADDPRRQLLREANYVPFDLWPDADGPRAVDSEAIFSVRTGRVYISHPKPGDAPALASTLAHELHHMERDRTESVNRMQEVDRERKAHAREAEDAERMLVALRNRANDPSSIEALEEAQAKAYALSAMYAVKFELFRLVQALDGIEGLREMPELYGPYEECIAVAQAKLSTDHGAELRLLGVISTAALATPAGERLAAALARAREAVAACEPLQAKVDELRARTGRR
jgi:hypothetical protein